MHPRASAEPDTKKMTGLRGFAIPAILLALKVSAVMHRLGRGIENSQLPLGGNYPGPQAREYAET